MTRPVVASPIAGAVSSGAELQALDFAAVAGCRAAHLIASPIVGAVSSGQDLEAHHFAAVAGC